MARSQILQGCAGLLGYVPPQRKACAAGDCKPDDDLINRWAFQYRYDEHHRVIEKRMPGADWECLFMVLTGGQIK
jgi:hypothetical protein